MTRTGTRPTKAIGKPSHSLLRDKAGAVEITAFTTSSAIVISNFFDSH